jgi:hypothetical protein
MAHDDDDNDGIAPRLTMAQVDELKGTLLEDGRQFFPALPALTANSLQGKQDHPEFCQECRDSPFLDREGHDKNRQIAEIIKKAVKDLKPHGPDGQPHFILKWRMYPNKDHPRFNKVDGCACGCGDSSL